MTKSILQVLAMASLVAVGALPVLVACGGGNKPASGPAPTPSDTSAAAGADSGTSALASSAPSAASAAPETAESDPAPLAQILLSDKSQVSTIFAAATAAPAATWKPPAGSDPLAKGVRDAAGKLSAGMVADGPMATGTVKEKQHLQADITLKPGKCYAIVGYSKKVKDLDLYLLLPPGILSGQDLTDDNKPIIGGPPQPMCPTQGVPITYKLDIFADAGGGPVAVQLFSKDK